MAFLKENITLKGLNLASVYLKITRLEYLSNKKQVKYTIGAFPSQENSKDEFMICEYFYGIHDIELGEEVPDILKQIYEDIRYRLTPESVAELEAEYQAAMVEPNNKYQTALANIPYPEGTDEYIIDKEKADRELARAESSASTKRHRYDALREVFEGVIDC